MSSFLAALAVDQVLSVAQLERHHRLSEGEAVGAGALVFGEALAKTQNSNSYEVHRFVTLRRKYRQLGGAKLRHLTGVAEMRYLLGAPAGEWVSDASSFHSKCEPDGVWATAQGEVAIEYDAGSYSPDQLLSKLISFRQYQTQVWGSPSRARVERIKALAERLEPGLVVLYAPWF